MKNLVRCKACGFIMEEGSHHECPACGVPSKMFEPYEDKIPANRRKLLDMHIHPIIVHAPQGLAFIMLIMAIIYVVVSQVVPGSEFAHGYLAITLQVLGIILPFTALAAMASGMLDAKYRYKTVKASLLVKKIMLGSGFIVVSTAMAVLAFLPGFSNSIPEQIGYLVASFACFGLSAFLGKWGAALTGGIMGGPFTKKKPAVKPATEATGS